MNKVGIVRYMFTYSKITMYYNMRVTAVPWVMRFNSILKTLRYGKNKSASLRAPLILYEILHYTKKNFIRSPEVHGLFLISDYAFKYITNLMQNVWHYETNGHLLIKLIHIRKGQFI